MEKQVENKEVNYTEYGYIGGEIIQVPVEEYFKLKELVDETLIEETKALMPEKYEWIDQATGKKIDKLTDKNKSTAQKIVNIEATLTTTPTIYRTPKGVKLLEIKLAMNQIHKNMVDSGVAKHIPTLQAQQDAIGKALSQEAPLGESAEATKE